MIRYLTSPLAINYSTPDPNYSTLLSGTETCNCTFLESYIHTCPVCVLYTVSCMNNILPSQSVFDNLHHHLTEQNVDDRGMAYQQRTLLVNYPGHMTLCIPVIAVKLLISARSPTRYSVEAQKKVRQPCRGF